jgi:hypothetical protein
MIKYKIEMKKTFIYLFVTVLLAGSSSCQKYLELQPQDGIIKEEFWKTKEQVQASVFGIYSSMMDDGRIVLRVGRESCG